jgi:hypothetical protein
MIAQPMKITGDVHRKNRDARLTAQRKYWK